MSDKLAFNIRKSAYILFESGMTADQVEKALQNTKQPTAGYYYSDDIYKLVKGAK